MSADAPADVDVAAAEAAAGAGPDNGDAATKIQAVYRGKRDRKRVAKRRGAAPLPPSHVKAPRSPPSAAESKSPSAAAAGGASAATSPMSRAPLPPPGVLSPSQAAAKARGESGDEDKAATRIQASYRGRAGRKRARARRKEQPPPPPGAPKDGGKPPTAPAGAGKPPMAPPSSAPSEGKAVGGAVDSDSKAAADGGSAGGEAGGDAGSAGQGSGERKALSRPGSAGSVGSQGSAGSGSGSRRSSLRSFGSRRSSRGSLGASLASLPPGVRLPSKGPKVGGKLKKKPSQLKISKAPPKVDPRADPSAAKIQAVYRGKRDRAKVAAEKRKRTKAATKIQASARGRRDRRRVALMEPPPPPRSHQEQSLAATKIQALYRGKRDRGFVAEKRNKRAAELAAIEKAKQHEAELQARLKREAQAATKIQASARGRRDRRRVAKIRETPRPTISVAPAHVPRPKFEPTPPLPFESFPAFELPPPTPAEELEKRNKKERVPPNIAQGAGILRKRNEELMKENEDLKKAVQESAKAVGELSVVRRQLMLKSSRLQELEDKDAGMSEELEALKHDALDAEGRLQDANKEIRTLEEAVEKEMEDFDKLRRAYDEKDVALNERIHEVLQLKADLKSAGRINDMMSTERQELLKRIDELQPETHEIALSARSIDDTPLLRARDRMLEAKDRQIVILNQKIEELSGNLDIVEAEVNSMQEDLVQRDVAFNKKKTEAAEHLAQVRALTRELKEQKGRDIAVDTAAKQNQQLLQLLEEAEKATQEAMKEKEDAMGRMQEAQDKLLGVVRESAGFEAEKETVARDARMLGRKVATMEARYTTREQRLVKELDDVRDAAREQITTMQEELRVRREKQYAQLDKLGKTEEQLHLEQQRAEESEALTRVLQQRNLELEAAALQAKKWRAEDAAAAKSAQEGLEAEIESLQAQLAEIVDERNTLTRQVREMGITMSELADAREQAVDDRQDAMERTRGKDGEVVVLRERVAQLMDEGMRANKARVEAEAQMRAAGDKLRVLQAEHLDLLIKVKGLGDNSGKARLLEQALRDKYGVPGMPGGGGGGGAGAGGIGGALGTGAWQGNSTAGAAGGGRDPTAASREAEAMARVRRLQARVEREVASKRRAVERMVLMHAGIKAAAAGGVAGGPMAGSAATAGGAFASGVAAGPGGSSGVAGSSVGGGSGGGGDGGDVAGAVLPLSGLGLTDEDVAVLVESLSAPLPLPRDGSGASVLDGLDDGVRRFRSIDLRYNAVTDAGAMLLAQLVSGASMAGSHGPDSGAGALTGTGSSGALPTVPPGAAGAYLSSARTPAHRKPLGGDVVNLDLRGNSISGAGVRALAEAVRSNVGLGVRHVYVGRGGLIQALGVDAAAPPRGSGDGGAGATADSDVHVVAVVDVSDNSGESSGNAALAAREMRGRVRASHLAGTGRVGSADAAGFTTGAVGPGRVGSMAPPAPAPMSASTSVGGAAGHSQFWSADGSDGGAVTSNAGSMGTRAANIVEPGYGGGGRASAPSTAGSGPLGPGGHPTPAWGSGQHSHAGAVPGSAARGPAVSPPREGAESDRSSHSGAGSARRDGGSASKPSRLARGGSHRGKKGKKAPGAAARRNSGGGAAARTGSVPKSRRGKVAKNASLPALTPPGR